MGKVYSEMTFKFWADPDVYAKEYGEHLPSERVLENAHQDFAELVTHQDDRVLPWRGAEIVTPQPFLLGDRTRRGLMRQYNEWRAVESVCELLGDHSETEASLLLGELGSYLFEIEDCGHQSVSVSGAGTEHVVTCDDCPVTWAVKDGAAVEFDPADPVLKKV